MKGERRIGCCIQGRVSVIIVGAEDTVRRIAISPSRYSGAIGEKPLGKTFGENFWAKTFGGKPLGENHWGKSLSVSVSVPIRDLHGTPVKLGMNIQRRGSRCSFVEGGGPWGLYKTHPASGGLLPPASLAT
jgi:hypothetical protein